MAGDRVRDEAERLVAAAMAAVSYATRGFGAAGRAGSGFATGSAECCVCPVCRVISAMREPTPELADRLAGGVSDLAAGVASFLRTLQRTGERDVAPEPGPPSEGDEFWESLRRKAADAAKAAARAASTMDRARQSTMEDDPWRVATAESAPAAGAPSPSAAAPAPRRAMARKAVKQAVPEPPAASRAASEAVATNAVATMAVAKKAVAKKAVAKKAVAKKAVAKKAVAKKAAPRRGEETGA